MQKRLGFVGIIVENRQAAAPSVNAVLTAFGHLMVARTGLPYEKRGCNVITLIVDATTDELGALTGSLGQIPGISVKAALAKPSAEKAAEGMR